MLLVLSLPVAQANPLLTFPLEINGLSIRAEVANTNKTRLSGLMYRKKLPKDQGMVFVYKNETQTAMWMKNTIIPLSVAFITRSGEILNIEKMQPMDLSHHSSSGPVKYALEMNQGWFVKNGVKSGDKLRGLEQLPPAE